MTGRWPGHNSSVDGSVGRREGDVGAAPRPHWADATCALVLPPPLRPPGSGRLVGVTRAPGGRSTVRSAARLAATSFTPWWTYHRTPDRAGHATSPVGGPLKRAWSKKLGAAVYGEPLVVGTTLIVATERNQVFGLNATNGHVRWQTGLGRPQPLRGLPCGDINPTGITSTPAYDPSDGVRLRRRRDPWRPPHPLGAQRRHRSPTLAPLARRAHPPRPPRRAAAGVPPRRARTRAGLVRSARR